MLYTIQTHIRLLAFIWIVSRLFSPTLIHAQETNPNLVILDETSVQNLGIQTVEATYQDFAETLFAIGRIEPIPARKSVLSSRIQGRVTKIHAFEGDIVDARTPIVEIESLQPGSPPPTISLSSDLPGMVMKSHTHIGKPVIPEIELFEIIDLTEVYAVARIPEEQAGKLSMGTKARISVAALKGQSIEGELVRFGTEANPLNGTIDAYFKLENSDYHLRPNMRAEFSVIIETSDNTLSVPREAIQKEGVNRVVFVKDFDLPFAYQKAPVKTGMQNEVRVEILSGLFPGDEVVTRGSYALLFAGKGGISLKDALDAAHGHEHNEDGSELTPEQKTQKTSNDEHDHESTHEGPLVLFLIILSSLLFILLLLSSLRRKTLSTAPSKRKPTNA